MAAGRKPANNFSSNYKHTNMKGIGGNWVVYNTKYYLACRKNFSAANAFAILYKWYK